MVDIYPGDTIRCLVGYYKSYAYGDLAIVKRLDVSSAGNPVFILANDFCEWGESMYSTDNWVLYKRANPKKEAQNMATVRAQYFGVRLEANPKGNQFLPMDISSNDEGYHWNEVTTLRHLRSDTIKDIRAVIKDGEKWAILQTCEFVEVAPTRPVLRDVQITSCR